MNGLQGLLQFDEEILKRIGSARRIVGKNQWIYVVLRHMTLVFFLLTTLFTLPSSFMPMVSLGAAGSDWLASLPNIVGESVPPVYWTVLVVLVWLLMLVLNGVIKLVYDSSVVQTTSNLSSDLQAYTQQLYLKDFKSAMDNINDEEASYGNDIDTSVWPERAKKWFRVAHWHGKRIEWLARYTSIEVWIMQRSLRLVDNFSRFVTFLFLLVFVLAARPQDLSGDMAAWSMVAIGAVSIMVFLGWDQLGKESTDPLGGSILGPDRQRWFQSVDIAGEFANQVVSVQGQGADSAKGSDARGRWRVMLWRSQRSNSVPLVRMTTAMRVDGSVYKRQELTGAREPIHVPYPRRPPEEIYTSYSILRGFTSRHTRDLYGLVFTIICVALVVYTGFASYADQSPIYPRDPSTVGAAGAAALLATIGTIYQFGKHRFATVDLFSSEILARVRISATDGYLQRIIAAFDGVSDGVGTLGGIGHTSLAPSQESNFELFHRHYEQLGALSPAVVDYVSDYYNYRVALRDEIRDLVSIDRDDPALHNVRKFHAVNIIYFTDLEMFSALRALNLLIEKDINKWHAWQLCCHVGVQANNFLRAVMPDDDPRFEEVVRRSAEYRRMVGRLQTALKANRGKAKLDRTETFF